MANVVIFGGSNTRPGEPAYEAAVWLGRALATAGHAVVTGGYVGVMEAASRGAVEAGGHSIGVTCAGLEAWRPLKPNAWVKEEVRSENLFERIETLIRLGDAAVVMPGGPGTLTEASLTWNMLLTSTIQPIPLVLVGEAWREVFEGFFVKFDRFIPLEQRKWLIFAQDVAEALAVLENSLASQAD